MHPQRVMEQFSMSMINRCDEIPRIQIDGDKRGIIALLYNQPVRFNPVQGITPGEKIFEFKLFSPAAQE
jgi:hypothetical protein